MICKLCHAPVEKLVKSHIIPEFLYKGMHDEKHRLAGLSLNPQIGDAVIQSGLWERLLCGHCDNVVLGARETHVSQLLEHGLESQSAIDGNDLRLRKLDYTQIRLFYLSLLWRMSMSSLQFFSEVALGPHQEPIRKMIIEANPGEPDEYGVLCIAPVFESEHLGVWTIRPDSVKQFGRTIYRCLIGGLLYCFFVGKGKVPLTISDRFIQKDGSWVILRKRIEEIKYLNDYCVNLGISINHREFKTVGLTAKKRATP